MKRITDQSETAPPIIRLVDVHKHFGRLRVLTGLTANFLPGRTTVVLGPSGCGKSVMLKHIVGLLRPDRGEVWYRDSRVDTRREIHLVEVRRHIGFLFQMGALFDSMTVAENIMFPLREHTTLSTRECRKQVDRVLRLVGLLDTAEQMPANLSGGQRKRIALARTIVTDPEVVLFDEPTTGLDPVRADVINELILKLKRDFQTTNIVVTHDLTSAFKIADRMIMMHQGKIVAEGLPSEFRASKDPVVQRFLQGEASEDDLSFIQSVRSDQGSSDDDA
jgi:phospholipid/cholesterol/gamma-HCH transport system ATP-binding protein